MATTDVYLFPVDMAKLTICIIPDKEVPVIEDVEMIKSYTRTSAEEQLYIELQEFIEAEKEYVKQHLIIIRSKRGKSFLVDEMSS